MKGHTITRPLVDALFGMLALLATATRAQGLWPVAARPDVRWTVEVVARDVDYSEDFLFAETRGLLIALKAASGREQWRQSIGNELSQRLSDPIAFIDGKIALGIGRSTLVLDRATGAVVSRTQVPGGNARFVVGPPLIVGTDRGVGSMLLRIDPSTGAILARRRLHTIEDLWLKNGVLVVRSLRSNPAEAPETHILTGIRATDLQRLWTFRADWPELEDISGTAVVGILGRQGRAYRPIDLQSGRLGSELPHRRPVRSQWGGATWELDTFDASNRSTVMRRNNPRTGAVAWTLEIPFSVTAFIREGERLFLSGGGGLAEVRWDTGTPARLICPLPNIRRLFRDGETFVAWTLDQRIIAFK